MVTAATPLVPRVELLLQAVGRYLLAVCPRNALTPDPAQPALRTPPPIFCEACRELADALGLGEIASYRFQRMGDGFKEKA